MKTVISASRRTDLIAFYPEWLAASLRDGEAGFLGPSGRFRRVDLKTESVHSLVLWSKDFRNLIENRFGLREAIQRYDQVYCHFTITGLGGSAIEKGAIPAAEALLQAGPLAAIIGSPLRISLRFDPIVYWEEGGQVSTNLGYFENVAAAASRLGIRDIRFSFAQWYGKAVRRADHSLFPYHDPSDEEKRADAETLALIAGSFGLNLHACCQDFLAGIPGIKPSSCIDGTLLSSLHPSGAPASLKKDRTQRKECRCTESVDIGSYAQPCPHSCLYCYANPKII